MKEFICYYFMNENKDSIKENAPMHSKHWSGIKVMGGPFSDYSGGFVVFRAISVEEAEGLVYSDPFITKNLLSEFWLKEWIKR